MKNRILTLVFSMLALSLCAFGQTSWLDRPLNNNWNTGNGIVPNAPNTLVAIDARCRGQIRNPESIADRAVTRAGWSLFGAAQTFGAVTMVNGMAGTDGMCRPTMFNTFVFVGTRFVGTLSPDVMNSREDGSLREATLVDASSITAEFNRYTSSDALCCPSQQSNVTYSITTGARGVVRATDADTSPICKPDGGVSTQDNVISGTVTYRQRIALPRTAVLSVRLEDVSRADASATIVAEQRIETEGKQVPIPFDLVYDQSKIQQRNRYSVRAEITDGGRLLYVSDTSNPVLTQGNPRTVDITVVPVRGGDGGGGGGQRDRTIRGTVTHMQRVALASDSRVIVRLIDLSATADVVAETTVDTKGRQVPIPFELTYENSRINFQRSYGLEAEITQNGVVAFRTERPEPIQLRGAQNTNVELTVVSAGPTAITGQTLSLSKFGTGSLKIGDRGTQFLVNGSVTVNTDGDAEVTVGGPLTGSTTFTGKLTYFDATTLRITVQNSGDADAAGEIEVRYSGRRLNSIAGNNLTLDGQAVTLRF